MRSRLSAIAQLLEQVIQAHRAVESLNYYFSLPTKKSAKKAVLSVENTNKWALLLDDKLSANMGKELHWALTGEELFRVSRALEAIAREVETVLVELERYQTQPDHALKQMCLVACQLLEELELSIKRLRKRVGGDDEGVVLAHRLANQGEKLYQTFRRKSLDNPNAVESLKHQELYKRFSNIFDFGDQAARVIGSGLVRETARQYRRFKEKGLKWGD